jgi:hypothetical protein
LVGVPASTTGLGVGTDGTPAALVSAAFVFAAFVSAAFVSAAFVRVSCSADAVETATRYARRALAERSRPRGDEQRLRGLQESKQVQSQLEVPA